MKTYGTHSDSRRQITPSGWRLEWWPCIGKAISSVVAVVGVGLSIASAHDAPTGWSYDPSCCNTLDCRQVASQYENRAQSHILIIEVSSGYKITRPIGEPEIIQWGDRRIRQSKDEFYHLCTAGGKDEGRTICLYAPLRGF